MPATSEDTPHRIGPRAGAASALFDEGREVASRAEIAALGAYFCVYLSWQAFRWLPGDQAFIGDLFFLPVGVAAVTLAWRASRACERHWARRPHPNVTPPAGRPPDQHKAPRGRPNLD